MIRFPFCNLKEPSGMLVLKESGVSTFKVPNGVAKVYVTVYPASGGGGGGGTPTGRFPEYGTAGGGGGGGRGIPTIRQEVEVRAGDAINIVVGAGGAGGSRGNPSSWWDGGQNGFTGGAGGLSYFGDIVFSSRGSGGGGGGWTGGGGSGGSIGGSSGGRGYGGAGAISWLESRYVNLIPDLLRGGHGGGPSSNGQRGDDALIIIEW